MKNIIKKFSLFLCLALGLGSAFFSFAITTSSKLIPSKQTENIQISEQVNNIGTLGLGDSFSYKTWGAEAMGVAEYSQYLLDIIEADNEHDELEEIVVAVLDTGIDTDNPWFTDRFLYDQNGKIFGLDFTADDPRAPTTTEYEFEDDQGHGTHCAGIICDMTLPNVKILPVKTMYNKNDEGTGDMKDNLYAIEALIDLKVNKHINIVAMNISLGMVYNPEDAKHKQLCDSFTKAIEDAYNVGIFSVVAAGNSITDAKNDLPANIERAITVSAIDDNLEQAYFSNYGDCIDVCAPGDNVASAYLSQGGEEMIAYMDGTSMSAPHISAYIALVKSDPIIDYSMQDIDYILTNKYNDIITVKDLGEAGKDDYYGYGLPILNNLINQVAYTVNYYLEPIYDLSSNIQPEFSAYELVDTKTLYGVIGGITRVSPEKFKGFSVIDFEQQTISDDTTVNVYYKRNVYTVTIQTGENGLESVSGGGQYLFGTTVKLVPVLQEGFIWDTWDIIQCNSNTFYLNFNSNDNEQTFVMPDTNLKLKAYAKPEVTKLSLKELDWENIITWGGGFIILIVFLMLLSKPRGKKH